MYVWRIKLFDDCRRLEHANNQITANNFAQDWYFSQGGTFGTNYYCTSHLSLCVGGPQPVSRVDSCLAKRGKEYDLQHCYIKWSRSRLLKYDFFYLELILEREGKRKNTNMGFFLMMIIIISNMLNHVQTLHLSHCLLISLSWRLKNSQVLFIFRYFVRSLDYCEWKLTIFNIVILQMPEFSVGEVAITKWGIWIQIWTVRRLAQPCCTIIR